MGAATTASVDQVTNFSVKVRLLAESYNTVKGGAKDLPSPFRPGLSATVDIESETVKGLAVPIQAIFTDNKNDSGNSSEDTEKQKSKLNDKQIKQYVYLFDAKTSTVKKAEVNTGIQNDQFIIVKKGLKAGEQIVSGPYSAIQNKLKDGTKVEQTSKDKLFTTGSKK